MWGVNSIPMFLNLYVNEYLPHGIVFTYMFASNCKEMSWFIYVLE